ncbi:MAG: hypothetical protein WBM00_04125 [Solirubrobacterales bacterium]
MLDRTIGKAIVKYGVPYLWRRYRREIRIAAGLLAAAAGIALYLANRNVPEG